MTGKDIRSARAKLGKLWGLDRPLRASELARTLRLKGRDPGATVLAWESGTPVSGPVTVAIEALLSGWRPAETPLPRGGKEHKNGTMFPTF